MATFDEVRGVLGQTLQLGDRTLTLMPETPLLGNLPELDSMAVVNLIAALEDQFGFAIDDDEISADVFATMASLARFVDQKLVQ
jgi:acyl carrier protein